MQELTPEGSKVIEQISAKYELSPESAVHMLVAVQRGGGTMAQFSIPELGSGQWMQGGMTMVGDMFNHQLKARVDNLCGELSQALNAQKLFKTPPPGSPGANAWWPEELGRPSSSGAQDGIQYAVFPSSRRLAVQVGSHVTIYDTLDHQIGGVSQQQGGSTSLTFSSQHGTISVSSLPIVNGPGEADPPKTNRAASPASTDSKIENFPAPSSESPTRPPTADIPGLLIKLKELHDQGILTDEEFGAKKKELLERL